MEITDARILKPEVQQELRKQAVRLCKKGMKQKQIAEILGVYPTTVSKWWRAYKKEGTIVFFGKLCFVQTQKYVRIILDRSMFPPPA